jgi:CHAD domain-containing protein
MVSDPLVRLGGDAEAVHQARVAVRRLRSSLRAFRPYLDREWVVDLRAELKALGGLLGGLRDADVMSARLLDRIEGMQGGAARGVDVVRALEARRRRTRRELIVALDEPEYVDLLQRLIAASRAPALSAGEVPRASALVQAVLVPPAGRLRTSVGRLGETPADAALHRVRIDAKGLRYAAEAVGPVAGRHVARLERAARLVQDVLGEHQDAVVAGTWLRSRAARSPAPAPWRALERMEIAAGERARAAWPGAWAKLERAMREAGL